MSESKPCMMMKYPIGFDAVVLACAEEELQHVGLDAHRELSVWALVDTSRKQPQFCEVKVVGTGERFEKGWNYVGTAHVGALIWHVIARWAVVSE